MAPEGTKFMANRWKTLATGAILTGMAATAVATSAAAATCSREATQNVSGGVAVQTTIVNNHRNSLLVLIDTPNDRSIDAAQAVVRPGEALVHEGVPKKLEEFRVLIKYRPSSKPVKIHYFAGADSGSRKTSWAGLFGGSGGRSIKIGCNRVFQAKEKRWVTTLTIAR